MVLLGRQNKVATPSTVKILELKAWLELLNNGKFRIFYRVYRSPEYDNERIERVSVIAFSVLTDNEHPSVYRFDLNYATVPITAPVNSKTLHDYCNQFIQFLKEKHHALPGKLVYFSRDQISPLNRSKSVWSMQ
ncbi:MAG: hypothetical protein ACFFBD_11120 [Candidatus Hodarchaeota archaeon]